MGTEDRLAVRQALAMLPLAQRAAVVLSFGCGLTHPEAAEALGVPLGTVKSHILRGRDRLRAALGEHVMTNVDERITTALRHDAPPPRDPVFRLQVLERRERQRFRRRALHALAGGAAVAVVSALTVSAGGEAYTAGSVLLFALVLITGAVVYLPEFGRLIRRLSI